MKSFKLTCATLAVAATLAVMGCASSTATKEQSSDQAARDYATFIEKAPNFKVQSVGNASADLLFSSIAEYAAQSREALVQLDKATTDHLDGYKAYVQREAFKKDGDAASLEKLEKDTATMTAIRQYQAAVIPVSAAQVAKRVALLNVVKGVLGVAAEKDKLLEGTSMLQKAAIGKSIAAAVDQANYAKDCSDYFDKINAQLENAQKDIGK